MEAFYFSDRHKRHKRFFWSPDRLRYISELYETKNEK